MKKLFGFFCFCSLEIFYLLIFLLILLGISFQADSQAKEMSEASVEAELSKTCQKANQTDYSTLGKTWFNHRVGGVKNQEVWQFISTNLDKPVYVRGITSFTTLFGFITLREFGGLVIKVFRDETDYKDFDAHRNKLRPPYFGNGEIAIAEIAYDKKKDCFNLSKLYVVNKNGKIEDLNNRRLFLGAELWQE